MPPFMLLISLSLGLLFQEASCVNLVRSEKDEVHFELKSSGAVHHALHKENEKPLLDTDIFNMKAWHEEQRKMDEVLKASGKICEADMCDFDYPVGTGQAKVGDGSKIPEDPENGCDCADTTNHQLILQEEMCIQAAKEAGVTAPTGVFLIPSELGHDRPKGCFKLPCKEDVRGICYFFNGIGDTPYGCLKAADGTLGKIFTDGRKRQIKGVPVCSRPKFLNGTIDGNDGCPNGYGVVMDEDKCREAGTCLGACEGEEFRKGVLNQSQHNDFPEGCFFEKAQGSQKVAVVDHGNSLANSSGGASLIQKAAPVTLSASVPCVYFNAPIAGVPKSQVLVGGTPICNVSTVTDFRSSPLLPPDQRLSSGHNGGSAFNGTSLLQREQPQSGEGEADDSDAGLSQSGSGDSGATQTQPSDHTSQSGAKVGRKQNSASTGDDDDSGEGNDDSS